jgi:hypothetical protein
MNLINNVNEYMNFLESSKEKLVKRNKINEHLHTVVSFITDIACDRFIKSNGSSFLAIQEDEKKRIKKSNLLIIGPNGILDTGKFKITCSDDEYKVIDMDTMNENSVETSLYNGSINLLNYMLACDTFDEKSELECGRTWGVDLYNLIKRLDEFISSLRKVVIELNNEANTKADLEKVASMFHPTKEGENSDVRVNGRPYTINESDIAKLGGDYEEDENGALLADDVVARAMKSAEELEKKKTLIKSKKYTAEEVNAMSDEELERLAGIIQTDGKTKTFIDGKEVEVKIVNAPTKEEIEAENKEGEDPAITEMKRQVAEFAKSPESSLIPEGAKLKEEKKEEKPVSTFGKNGKPTVTLKKAGDKGVLNKKPDFSKATLTASADTPSPIEGIPAMFALNDVAKDAHNLRGGSVRMVKGEDGKMYAEPMKADDMKRINDTIFPKEAYTHNTATGEKLGTPFGDEIMRVFNTSAGEPKVETAPNVVDFTKVDGEEEIVKEDIENLWYIDRANKKLIPFIKKYGKPTYDNNYEAFVLVNPDILFVGNGEVSKMDENSVSDEEEGQLIYDILINIVTNPNKPENDMYSEDFIESATEWVNSIYDNEHAEEIDDDGLDEFREEE